MNQSSIKGFSLPLAMLGRSLSFIKQSLSDYLKKIIGWRVGGESDGKTEYGPELPAVNWSKGTTIALIMQNKEGGLIEVIEACGSGTSTQSRSPRDRGAASLQQPEDPQRFVRSFGPS